MTRVESLKENQEMLRDNTAPLDRDRSGGGFDANAELDQINQEIDGTIAKQLENLDYNEAEGVDDIDYEFNGGDAGMYHSRIDDINELKTLYTTLRTMSETDKPSYDRLIEYLPA